MTCPGFYSVNELKKTNCARKVSRFFLLIESSEPNLSFWHNKTQKSIYQVDKLSNLNPSLVIFIRMKLLQPYDWALFPPCNCFKPCLDNNSWKSSQKLEKTFNFCIKSCPLYELNSSVRGLSQITFALRVGRWSEKRVVYYIKSAN